jgi:hypothetical protein
MVMVRNIAQETVWEEDHALIANVSAIVDTKALIVDLEHNE